MVCWVQTPFEPIITPYKGGSPAPERPVLDPGTGQSQFFLYVIYFTTVDFHGKLSGRPCPTWTGMSPQGHVLSLGTGLV